MSDLISRQAAIEAVGLNTWAGSRISKLSTIEAIPIEWLKKRFMDKNSSKWSYDWHVIADCLIAEWEKENGKSDIINR